MVSSVIIVGASAAGVAAARTLRDEGFGGSVTLIDGDPHGAYERPPLSKAVLQDASLAAEDISLLSPEAAEKLGINTLYGVRCVSVSAQGEVTLSSGETLHADKVILATGGIARPLPLDNSDLEGIHTLRHFADAESLRQQLKTPACVAVIGGGLIGSEVVASLTSMGHKVHWIDAAPKPLAHILPEAIVDPMLEWFRTTGVEITANAQIAAFEGDAAGKVCAVRFQDGTRLAVDCILIGVGMIPDTALAEAAGLELALGGIAVGADQQTSTKAIYAAGDVAAVRQPDGSFKRHEHWQAAEHQGANAARHILGQEPLPEPVAWYWSDQADNHLEMTGRKGTQSAVRRADGDHWPSVFELEDGKLVGAVSINNPNPVRVATRLIKAGKPVSSEELADPSVDLRGLLRR